MITILSLNLVIRTGNFPDSLENKFTFTKANLSTSNLVFAIFIRALHVSLISMVMDIYTFTKARSGAVSLLITEVETIVSALHHCHLHVHIWCLLKSNQCFIYSNVLTINKVLISLNTLVSDHCSIRPVFALNFRKKSYTHEIYLESTSINSSNLSKSLIKICRSRFQH